MENIIGLRELREKTESLISKIGKGASFLVLKKSKPIFRVVPVNEDDQWEEVVNFTKIKRGGVNIKEILSRL